MQQQCSRDVFRRCPVQISAGPLAILIGEGGCSLPPYLKGNTAEHLDYAMSASFEILYYN